MSDESPDSDLDSFLDSIQRLCAPYHLRHSRFQLERFVIKQPGWSPDLQFKQCIRELRTRYAIVQERRFERRSLTLQVEALSLKIKEVEKALANIIDNAIFSDTDRGLRRNEIAQLENQIDLLTFKSGEIQVDIDDLVREMRIVHEVSQVLADQRKFATLEDAEADFWMNRPRKLPSA